MLRKFKLTSITGLVIDPRSSVEWDAIPLKVPAVSPTINNCCLIRVEYFVRVILEVRGGKNLSTDLPITVGTVPLESSSCSLLPSPPPLPPPTPIQCCPSNTPPPPRDAPPPYNESLLSCSSDVGDSVELTFTPSYTLVSNSVSGSTFCVPDDPPAYSEIDPNPVAL